MAKTVTRRKVLNLRSVFYGVVKTYVRYGFYGAHNFLGTWIIAFFPASSWAETFFLDDNNFNIYLYGSKLHFVPETLNIVLGLHANAKTIISLLSVDSWYFLKQKEPEIRNKTRRFWQKTQQKQKHDNRSQTFFRGFILRA